MITASEKLSVDGLISHKKQHGPGGIDPKVYHTPEHLLALERYEAKIAKALKLSPEQRALIKIAIARHDLVIEYDEANPNDILAMIRRYRGAREGDEPKSTKGNEGESGRLTREEMLKANEQAGEEIFSKEQIDNVVWAIDATYPDVKFGAVFKEYPYYKIVTKQNPALEEMFIKLEKAGIVKGSLFFQPHLEGPLEKGELVPREVLVTALVDLGAAGLADNREFYKSGDDEMRELYGNLRLPEVMERLVNGDNEEDKNDRARATSVFLEWLDSQPGFVAWQALRFEKIRYLLKKQNGINEDEEKKLREQFSHYPDNLSATLNRALKLREQVGTTKKEKGEKLAFLYIAREMGYEF